MSVTPSSLASPATTVVATAPAETRTSVPEVCVETAELADEVIALLNRNVRDDRLATALKGYTLASQACREQARP